MANDPREQFEKDPREFIRAAAAKAAAQGEVTAQEAVQTIFSEGPKPFRYSAELRTPDDGGLPVSVWEFEVPNGKVTGWLRKEDLEGVRDIINELLEEINNPANDIVRPVPRLWRPGT